MIEPAQGDPLVAAMSAAIGGPRGRHGQGHLRWFPASAVVVALAAVMFAVGMLQKADCAVRGWDSTIRYTHMCASGLSASYATQTHDHPVLSTYWAVVIAKITHAVHDSTTTFMVINGIGLALLTMAAAFLLSRVRPDRPWDAAVFALSPVLTLTGLLSSDLLAVAGVAGALWAYARGWEGLTGLLIGLASTVHLYPALLLLALLILAARRRDWLGWAMTAAATVFTWAVINVPVVLTHGAAWRSFWSTAWHRGAEPGSLWMLIQDASDRPIAGTTISLCAVILFLTWACGVAALGLLSSREPSPAQLGLLLVIGYVLVAKSYPPQDALWLLPLAALAHPRWRDQLAWQGAEVLFFCATWWNAAGLMTSGDGPAAMYDIVTAVRLVAEVGLAALVVWDLVRPRAQMMTVSSNVVVV